MERTKEQAKANPQRGDIFLDFDGTIYRVIDRYYTDARHGMVSGDFVLYDKLGDRHNNCQFRVECSLSTWVFLSNSTFAVHIAEWDGMGAIERWKMKHGGKAR